MLGENFIHTYSYLVLAWQQCLLSNVLQYARWKAFTIIWHYLMEGWGYEAENVGMTNLYWCYSTSWQLYYTKVKPVSHVLFYKYLTEWYVQWHKSGVSRLSDTIDCSFVVSSWGAQSNKLSVPHSRHFNTY
jgi:hypothetical protein